MQFDPITKYLYSDNGIFFKKMYCPYNVNWMELDSTNSTYRKCSKCDHLIVDSKYLDDVDLVHLIESNPNACLRLDMNQENIKIVSNGILDQK
jgi:hypothetical protein